MFMMKVIEREEREDEQVEDEERRQRIDSFWGVSYA